jgi:hypothetical protein
MSPRLFLGLIDPLWRDFGGGGMPYFACRMYTMPLARVQEGMNRGVVQAQRRFLVFRHDALTVFDNLSNPHLSVNLRDTYKRKMSPEAEAGPSTVKPQAQGPPTKGAGRKRKAGGDGKKGKVFLEDKVCPVYYHGNHGTDSRRASSPSCLVSPEVKTWSSSPSSIISDVGIIQPTSQRRKQLLDLIKIKRKRGMRRRSWIIELW